ARCGRPVSPSPSAPHERARGDVAGYTPRKRFHAGFPTVPVVSGPMPEAPGIVRRRSPQSAGRSLRTAGRRVPDSGAPRPTSDGQEPMDVAASGADVAIGLWPGPLQVEELCDGAVQLRVTVMEAVEPADLTAQADAGDDGRFRFGLVEESHCSLGR